MTDDFSRPPEGRVDRIVVGKAFSHVGINDYNIGALLIPFCVPAPEDD